MKIKKTFTMSNEVFDILNTLSHENKKSMSAYLEFIITDRQKFEREVKKLVEEMKAKGINPDDN